MTRKQAEAAIDAIFEDLRDRRFLKWLFDAEPESMGPILHDSSGTPLMALNREVQADIREAWIGILMKTRPDADAGR